MLVRNLFFDISKTAQPQIAKYFISDTQNDFLFCFTYCDQYF